jgi:uncharacterized HAD superfamily protein
MKIGIDIDGVTADGIAALADWTEAVYGIKFTREDMTAWDAQVGGKHVGKLYAEAYQFPEVVAGIEPIAGAPEAINRIAKRNGIVFLTARPSYAEGPTRVWIAKHIGAQYPVHVVPRVKGSDDRDHKGDKSQYGIGVLIDDHVDNIENAVRGGAVGILFNQPWNARFEPDITEAQRAFYFRVKTWAEVEHVVSFLEIRPNTTRRIIALSGKAGHGKDQTAAFISEFAAPMGIKTQRVGFADAVKERARALGWDGEKNQNGRTLLQYIGARERKDDPEYWVRQLLERIGREDTTDTLWIITDCRYHNEAQAVKLCGGTVWRLNRRNYTSALNAEQQKHSSEVDLDDYEAFDARIEAATLDELKDAIYAVLRVPLAT